MITTPAFSEIHTSSSVSVIKHVYPRVDELLQPKIWQENLSFSFDSTAKSTVGPTLPKRNSAGSTENTEEQRWILKDMVISHYISIHIHRINSVAEEYTSLIPREPYKKRQGPWYCFPASFPPRVWLSEGAGTAPTPLCTWKAKRLLGAAFLPCINCDFLSCQKGNSVLTLLAFLRLCWAKIDNRPRRWKVGILQRLLHLTQ